MVRALGHRVGVVRDDLHAALLRPLQRRRHGVRIGGGDDDRLVALADGGVDERHLLRAGRLRRRVVGDRVSELLGGFLGALVARVEVRVARDSSAAGRSCTSLRSCSDRLPTPAASPAARATTAPRPRARANRVLRICFNLLVGLFNSGSDWNLVSCAAPPPFERRMLSSTAYRAAVRGARDVPGENRCDEQPADDHVLGGAAQVVELHAVAQLGDEDRGEQDAERSSPSRRRCSRHRARPR